MQDSEGPGAGGMERGGSYPSLAAADGLVLRGDRSCGGWRLGFGTGDWLGPIRLGAGVAPASDVPLPFSGEDDLGSFGGLALTSPDSDLAASVRAYRERRLLVFRLEARRSLDGLATGSFDEPGRVWPWLRPDEREPGGLPEASRAFGHQYTEFALPTFSPPDLTGFFMLPFRPAIVEPLFLLAPDGASLMLAPLDAFHEQVIAVPRTADDRTRGVRCGWHGDLERVPEGFASELGVFAGDGPRALLDEWAAILLRRHATRRPSRRADPGVAKLSYWTDNGAAYWYRSEEGVEVAENLVAVADRLRADGIPFEAFQLDSWFYPQEKLRSFNADAKDVPPTGMLRWEARDDILPDGIADLRARLGSPPLILHSRHFSSQSDYFGPGGVPAWRDGDRAHPVDPRFFARLLGQAADWGAVTFEQDWLVEMFLGVKGLREEPGRVRAWQQTVDRIAAEHGLTLQWCMASPADFFASVMLERVSSIRTSGDYRYIVGSGALWTWFLLGNGLARALGLHPFKDVFLSSSQGEGLDGDPQADAEALLATLSAGPVGIGDRLGRSDRTRILRTCRPDGWIVKPDLPIAALDRCYRASPFQEAVPLVGETRSEHPAGTWIYLASFHASQTSEPLHAEIGLDELGRHAPGGPVLAWDWRARRFARLEPGATIDLVLEPRDWDLRILCPILEGAITLVGDPNLYASIGEGRVRGLRTTAEGIALDVLGAPGERVELCGWAEGHVRSDLPVERGPAGDGTFRLEVPVGDRGWRALDLVHER